MTDDKTLEKIKKLFALGASDNPNESATALRMAQELMAKHNLDTGSLYLSEVTHTDIKSQASVSKLKPHENALLWTVTKAFGCTFMVYTAATDMRDNWMRFRIIGPKSQVPLAAYTAEVLLRKLGNGRKEFMKQFEGRGYDRKSLTMQGDGFSLGWVRAIASTVHAFAGNTPGVTEAIEHYVRKLNPDGTTAEAQKRKLGALGYEAGEKAAAGESLFRPMGAAKAAARVGETRRISA